MRCTGWLLSVKLALSIELQGESGMADETAPGDEPPAGKPKYDQSFFLDLAAKGKNAWNAWRRANKDVYVTFAGVDFSEMPKDKIDFTGFEFGDCADFSQCKWRGVDLFRAGATDIFKPGRACFPGASFGARAKFEGATFKDFASFTGASFGDPASFTGTAFGHYASFTGRVVFGAQASFEFAAFDFAALFNAADFDAGVSFRGATFGEGASFQDAVIGSVSNFEGTAFGDWTFFDAAIFNGAVTFRGKSIVQWTGLFQLVTHGFSPDARRALKKMHEESWRINGSAPDRFLNISFPNTRFGGDANFSDRSFGHRANFTDVRFYRPPDFDAVTNASRIDFTGARISLVSRGKLPWDSEAIVRLRAFRKVAEETKNHDLERDLYIEERKAELGIDLHTGIESLRKEGWKNWPRNAALLTNSGLWIFVMGSYWALANYGRNFLLPAAWLVLSVPFFYWCYSQVLASLMQQAGPASATKYDRALWMLAFGNAVPFVGPLTVDSEIKKFLFCPLNNCPTPIIPPEGYQLAVLSQNLFSIILVFFIGLALRNYFKIK
jgi:hypothetical protein